MAEADLSPGMNGKSTTQADLNKLRPGMAPKNQFP